MSHVCGKTSSAKDKGSGVFYRKIKPPMKDSFTTRKVGADCKCAKCTKSDCHHKMKRLLTRKERNQMWDSGKEASKAKSCHYFYSNQISKDVSHVHQYCSNTFTTGRFPNVAPVTHEPSVITDSRLIGHHGLFNHEVKSIDIERLLSEQRKVDRNERLAQNSNPSLCNSAFATDPLSNERQCLFESSEAAGRFKLKDLPTTKTFNQESNSQCSDLTPGQRPRNTHNSSTVTNMNDKSSKHSSPDAGFSKISAAPPVLFDINCEPNKTPSSFHENLTNVLQESVASFIECTPKKPASASNQTKTSHPSPQLPSSPAIAEASNNLATQEHSLVSDSVEMSVKAIATRLCNSVSFSLLKKKRNLVTESRSALLNALQQRHGSQLQRNILKIQEQLYFYDHEEEQGEVSEPCHIPEFADKEKSFSADEFTATNFATSSSEKIERVDFDWNSTDWSNPLEPTLDWLGIPAESPIVLDDTFSRRCSPLFPVDFEFKKSFSMETKHLFPLSPSSSCADGPRSSGHVEDFFISTKGQEFAMPDSTRNYRNFPDRTLRYRRSPRTHIVDDHHYSADPRRTVSAPFPQVHSLFGTHNYSYGKTFSEDIQHFPQGSSFDPFSHLSLPSASPVLRHPHIDLAGYPPSYMLERDPSLSTGSCFPSPEHWSFPPMRLY